MGLYKKIKWNVYEIRNFVSHFWELNLTKTKAEGFIAVWWGKRFENSNEMVRHLIGFEIGICNTMVSKRNIIMVQNDAK